MSKVIRAATFAAMLVLLPANVSGQGTKPPQLTLRDLRGRTLRLSDYRGKVVLINFWATWCPPCRAEIPDLIKLQKEYGKSGLQIIGVTYPPERRARVRRFAASLKVNYPIALGTRGTKARFSPDETLPLTVIIDRAGEIRGVVRGILLEDEFREKVEPLLRRETEGVRKSRASRSLRGS